MIACNDAHRDLFGVERICRVLRAVIPRFLTSRGYRAAPDPPAVRSRNPRRAADRLTCVRCTGRTNGLWDQEYAPGHEASWLAPRQRTDPPFDAKGWGSAVCSVEAGVSPRLPIPPRPGPPTWHPRFQGPNANRLWVAGITFVRTWQGFCQTAFGTNACTKKIAGWAASATIRTEDLTLQDFNHAV